MIHSASLVHDDLPAFDAADMRRGKPSVHRAYGEPLAVLAGDSLIVLAFEVLALAGKAAPDRALALIRVLAQRTGMPMGICAGQGWAGKVRRRSICQPITAPKPGHFSLPPPRWVRLRQARTPSLGKSLGRALVRHFKWLMICAMRFAMPKCWANRWG